jgi:predicted DNA-binding transcriptional regulator AlpA
LTNPKEMHRMTTKSINKQRLSRPALPALPDGQEFVTADQIAALLKISKRTLFRLRANRSLPDPVEISTNCLRWRLSDIIAYLNNLKKRKPCRRR